MRHRRPRKSNFRRVASTERRRFDKPNRPMRRRRRQADDEHNVKHKVPPKDTAPDFIEETYYTREKGAPSRGKEYTTVPERDKPGLKKPGEIVREARRRRQAIDYGYDHPQTPELTLAETILEALERGGAEEVMLLPHAAAPRIKGKFIWPEEMVVFEGPSAVSPAWRVVERTMKSLGFRQHRDDPNAFTKNGLVAAIYPQDDRNILGTWLLIVAEDRYKSASVKRHRRGGFDTPESVARELTLWIDNTQPIYKHKRAIEKNLIRKMANGTYDHDLAVKAFIHVVEYGAKDYAREFGGPGARWFEIFPKDIRIMAAEELRDDFEQEVEAYPEGYEEFVPKKYMKDWQSRYSAIRRKHFAFYNIDKPVYLWSRRELEDYLEDRGFAVYDDEPTQDLREAVEEDLRTEGYYYNE